MSFSLGTYVEDIVTGFRGVVTSRTDHLAGATEYGVTPRAPREGEYPPTEYLAAKRLREIGSSVKMGSEITPSIRLFGNFSGMFEPPCGDGTRVAPEPEPAPEPTPVPASAAETPKPARKTAAKPIPHTKTRKR